jgi:hypothetical protein
MRLRAFALALALTILGGVSAFAQSGGTVLEQHSAPAKTTAAWTSATALNTAATVTVTNLAKVVVTLSATSTMTGGVLSFEVDDGSGIWWAIAATRAAGASTAGTSETTFTLAVVNQAWEVDVAGWSQFRVRLSTVISGTGTASVAILPTAAEAEPAVVVSQATAANLQATVNVAQVNGVTVTTGAGATGTGVQRINDVASSATGAAVPASAQFTGGLGSGATGGFLVGATACDSNKVITITSATTTLMITGVASRNVHICAMHVVTATANNVALVEGTGATCATGTAGMAGGTTAANGWNFAANGGIALGAGWGDIMTTSTTGDSVCLITSAAGPLAGFIKYAIY